MKRKYRIKKNAKNEFTQLTGILAVQVQAPDGCLVVDQLTVTGNIPIQRYAYRLYEYYGKGPLSRSVSVSSGCGAQNCVKKEHLVAEFKPNKEDKEYLNGYGKVDDPSRRSHVLKVPVSLL